MVFGCRVDLLKLKLMFFRLMEIGIGQLFGLMVWLGWEFGYLLLQLLMLLLLLFRLVQFGVIGVGVIIVVVGVGFSGIMMLIEVSMLLNQFFVGVVMFWLLKLVWQVILVWIVMCFLKVVCRFMLILVVKLLFLCLCGLLLFSVGYFFFDFWQFRFISRYGFQLWFLEMKW